MNSRIDESPAAVRVVPPHLNSELVRWAFSLFRSTPNQHDLTRTTYAYPFAGNYGLAGVLLCVEGSPPRAAVAIDHASGKLVAWRFGSRIVTGERNGKGIAGRRFSEAIRWLARLGCEVAA